MNSCVRVDAEANSSRMLGLLGDPDEGAGTQSEA